MYRILIVDDEPGIRTGLKAALSHKSDYEILTASDGLNALAIMEKQAVDIIISDIKMPKMDGLALQKEALLKNPQQIVILLTAYGSVETAVEAMRLGAYDFLTKPINLDQFEMVVERALEHRQQDAENKHLRKELEKVKSLENLVGRSRIMQKLFDQLQIIAETRSTVLVVGESGTGKELIAHAIHNLSPRKNKSFIAVNCAALSENLIESELFGHEKGAFTGAIAKKDGRFKVAHGGTLFLDEIGELPMHTQVKLLRVIQEKTFEPVGGNFSITVDVRIIAATNQNLETAVQQGSFREDLYYRLNVIKVEAPPLRERRDDIPMLVGHFIEEFCRDMQKSLKTITAPALAKLTEYTWPGNVRELRNTVENLVVFSKGGEITLEQIPESILNFQGRAVESRSNSVNLVENEKHLILRALEETRFNKTQAARKLGMSRRTIHRKIKEYGLET